MSKARISRLALAHTWWDDVSTFLYTENKTSYLSLLESLIDEAYNPQSICLITPVILYA